MKFIVIVALCLGPFLAIGQITEEELMRMLDNNPEEQYIGTATVGILQGGGSLIGVDLEFLIEQKFGVQVGAGLVGYGAALNYHPEGGIRSSFVSLGYWHQGLGEGFVQSLMGPSYVFRGKKWFTAQLGLGFQLKKGPFAANLDPDALPPVQLLYSIGGYFPIR